MDIIKEWDKLTDAEKIAYIDNNLIDIDPVIDPAKEKLKKANDSIKK